MFYSRSIAAHAERMAKARATKHGGRVAARAALAASMDRMRDLLARRGIDHEGSGPAQPGFVAASMANMKKLIASGAQ